MRSFPYCPPLFSLFFRLPPAPTDLYTLSLHDALPISTPCPSRCTPPIFKRNGTSLSPSTIRHGVREVPFRDRKSTRLNSSHVAISYAVFCLKKKKNGEKEDGTVNH